MLGGFEVGGVAPGTGAVRRNPPYKGTNQPLWNFGRHRWSFHAVLTPQFYNFATFGSLNQMLHLMSLESISRFSWALFTSSEPVCHFLL